MTPRKFQLFDELEKNHYVELATDARKRSVMINSYSQGQHTSVMVDMAKLKQAMDELNI